MQTVLMIRCSCTVSMLQSEEQEMWPPATHTEIEHAPAPAVIMTCFKAWSSLCEYFFHVSFGLFF
jgi:hypothetical protein